IEECLQTAVAAMGFSYGPIHAEFRLNEKGVWPLEIAPRPIGGLFARGLDFWPFGHGGLVGLGEILFHHATELPEIELQRESQASGVMMIPVPRSGIYEGVSGAEAARAVAGVEELIITAREHDSIGAWPEGSSYLGFLFGRAETPEQVETALRKAHSQLEFQIVPELPVGHPVTGQL